MEDQNKPQESVSPVASDALLSAAWVNRLPKYCRDEAIARTKREDFAVFIEQRSDIGPWLFAVIDAENDGADDFWLDAFPTYDEAENFMREMGWNYSANAKADSSAVAG